MVVLKRRVRPTPNLLPYEAGEKVLQVTENGEMAPKLMWGLQKHKDLLNANYG